MFKYPLEHSDQNRNVPNKNHVTRQEKTKKLLKKYSSGTAVPFVSMIIFENQFSVEMMQYIKKETETYYS